MPKTTDEDVYEYIARMMNQNNAGGNQSLPQSTISDTIYTDTIDQPAGSSGGSSGTGMMDSFSSLGNAIQNNALNTIDQIYAYHEKALERSRQARQDKESRRQFDVTAGLSARDRNLTGMNYLYGVRSAAANRRRLPFNDAVYQAIAG